MLNVMLNFVWLVVTGRVSRDIHERGNSASREFEYETVLRCGFFNGCKLSPHNFVQTFMNDTQLTDYQELSTRVGGWGMAPSTSVF